MAKAKVRLSGRNKWKWIPLVIVIVAAAYYLMTMISPSASILRVSGPSISGVSPSSAKIGSVVAIRGRNFQPGTSEIYMGGGIVTNYLANSNSSTLNIYVPDSVCQAPIKAGNCKKITINPGSTYKLYVKDLNGNKSNEVNFTVSKR
jgi:hypothetical protein